jgi:hypothetical protein
MEGYVGALELTAIAFATLLFISFCFILLTRLMQWAAKLGKKGGRLHHDNVEVS